MVLFGGGRVNVELQHGEFIISLDDGWIRFTAASHEVSRVIHRVSVFVWYIKFSSAKDNITTIIRIQCTETTFCLRCVVFFAHVGCWAGEGAALGAWPTPGGKDKKPQHGLDHLPTRVPHHTHNSITYLNPVTHMITHIFPTYAACKVMKHTSHQSCMPFLLFWYIKYNFPCLCYIWMYWNLDLSPYWILEE